MKRAISLRRHSVKEWTMSRPCLSLILVVFGCASQVPPLATVSAFDLIEADRARAAAMVSADGAALEAALHDELTYAHSTGSVDSKVQLIATLIAGEIDYLSIESPTPLVRIRGSIGVVTGPVEMRVEAAGRVHEVRSVYLAVYALEGDRWVLLAYQSTSHATK